VIESRDKGRIRFDYVDLATADFIQLREGGGKKPQEKGETYRGSAPGSGFHLVSAKTLAEVMDDPAYTDVVQGMKEQLIRLVQDALRMGLLTREELG